MISDQETLQRLRSSLKKTIINLAYTETCETPNLTSQDAVLTGKHSW